MVHVYPLFARQIERMDERFAKFKKSPRAFVDADGNLLTETCVCVCAAGKGSCHEMSSS